MKWVFFWKGNIIGVSVILTSSSHKSSHYSKVKYYTLFWQLVVKVLLNDGSSKTLMVDERQNVREVLDNLFEKTHCDCNVDWSLCETNPELNLGELPHSIIYTVLWFMLHSAVATSS